MKAEKNICQNRSYACIIIYIFTKNRCESKGVFIMANVTDLLHEILDYAWDYYDDLADQLSMHMSTDPVVVQNLEKLREKADKMVQLRDNVDYFDGHLTEEENDLMADAVQIFTEYNTATRIFLGRYFFWFRFFGEIRIYKHKTNSLNRLQF